MEEIKIIKNGVEYVLTEQRLRELAAKFIETCGKQAVEFNDFGMNAKMVDMLIKTKQAWFPAISKNINLNVQDFDKKLAIWMNARKEFHIIEKKKLVE